MKVLKELRKRYNWTQQDMAKKLGITRPAYTRYETGEREPDFEMMKKLSNIFGVSTDYLIGNTNFIHEGEIAAAHIKDGLSYDDLTPEAIQQLEEYKQFLIQKYGKKNDINTEK